MAMKVGSPEAKGQIASAGTNEVDAVTMKLAGLDMGRIRDGQVLFDDLTAAFPIMLGKAVSKKEREELKLKNQTLTYGYSHCFRLIDLMR
jgi:hypothetical protein